MFEKVDFVGGWKLYFSISGVLLLAGVVAIALGGLNLGIDFEGGAQFTVTNAERNLSDAQIRAALEVYPEVETPERYRNGPGEQQNAGDREVQLPAADEVYVLEHAYLTLACCA